MTTKRLSKVLTWMNPSNPSKDRGAHSPDKTPRKTWNNLPTFDELPKFKEFDGCAWEVWGKDDQLGTINLLTEDVVKRAASEEIALGTTVSLNWRDALDEMMKLTSYVKPFPYKLMSVDVKYPQNTQSGSQWDGLRHFGLMEHGVFYNNIHMDTMVGGVVPLADPKNIDSALARIGIQSESSDHHFGEVSGHLLLFFRLGSSRYTFPVLPPPPVVAEFPTPVDWADHGICGRGVLIDLVRYYTASAPGTQERKLPYDPWTTHGFTVKEIEAVAAQQGVKFRQGDILLLRAGFIKKYQDATQEERDELVGKPETLNNHFAAIASDQPALEVWLACIRNSGGVDLMIVALFIALANIGRYTAHASDAAWVSLMVIVMRLASLRYPDSLWGMPIGEMFDLEKLSQICAETGRYTFFFTSWPLPIIGGCASPPNAADTLIVGPNWLDLDLNITQLLVAIDNDALFEFENFKKKFLLANKHITKLNSTLSVRIEELNAQISILYTENLRLRASEIALATQLKKEREKSRKIIAETEVAVSGDQTTQFFAHLDVFREALGLTKHLTFLRRAFNISEQSPQSPSPTPPKATRRPADQSSPTSLIIPKLAREPTIPRIHEDEEPSASSDDEPEETKVLKLSPRRKAKARARLSASRLPLPLRIASPPPEASTSSIPLQIDFESIPQPTTKRKTSRRQSGLVIDTRMTVGVDNTSAAGPLSIPRPPSPAFGSPIRRAAGLAEERDENAISHLGGKNVKRELDEPPVTVKKPKSLKREKEGIVLDSESVEKKKKKNREDGEVLSSEGGGEKKPKFKDVTNSPPVHTPVDPTVMSDFEAAPSSGRTSHLPTPSPPPGEVDADLAAGGRERRVRRSVNYAEPKLNTKMRKPDGPEGNAAATNRKRSSSSTGTRSAATATQKTRGEDFDVPEEAPAEDARFSLERDDPVRVRQSSTTTSSTLPPPSSTSLKRHKSRPILIEDDEEDDGVEADEEYVPSYGRSSWVNVGERRRVKDRRATGGGGGGGVASSLDDRRHSLAV
ncbi:hypothetical protein PQX77_006851 [Marasmius sp. AFHP31]|nr:hypothetical protein PQX77_006851 [Marasmius sp. AFHP31]